MAVMRALVWRYVCEQHRHIEEAPVTEDHINEVKGEITSSKYDLIEVLAKNGFDTSSVPLTHKEKGNIYILIVVLIDASTEKNVLLLQQSLEGK